MCLIIHKPKGVNIPEDIVASATQWNPDGFGIMSEGKARKWHSRSPQDISIMLEEYEHKECAVHFRMATDGQVTKRLAHPFQLKNKTWLMHNGILSQYRTDKNAVESDTTRFVKEFCNPLISKHGSVPKELLEKEISGSKVAIMQKDGTITRYGGNWYSQDDLHFSNTYAWDSPMMSSAAKYGSYGGVITGDYDDAEWWESRAYSDRSGSVIIDDMTQRLLAIADMLPLHIPDYVHYEDFGLWDDLIAGTLHVDDFLCCCSSETLLELYTVSVSQNLIAA